MGIVIGTAGWSIARKDFGAFPADGTGLERYSRVFNGVEVNSSFYRPHRVSTWAKWAASVPDGFRFAVKVPRTITHEARLIDVDMQIAQLAREIESLGPKLGPLLVQLPPTLRFDASVTERFFTELRTYIDAQIVCEPRHVTWFDDGADALLERLRVARVAADPALVPAAAAPGGWRGIAYWRLHGSPIMYRSAYPDEAINAYARQIRASIDGEHDVWCVFDNTAHFSATGDALSLMAKLRAGDSSD